jgi:hypothetical protein
MHFKVAVVGVGLAGKQRLHFSARDIGFEALERCLGVKNRLLIVLGFAELDHSKLIVELLLNATDGIKLILKRSALLHHALRALLVVPEIGIFGLPIKLNKARTRLIDVKDASSAVRATA